MHKLFSVLALLPIYASGESYFVVPNTWNPADQEFSNYIYEIGTYTVFRGFTDLDYATLWLTCDQENYSRLSGIEYGVWDFQWKVNLPYTSSNEVSQACWLVIADYQTGDIFNASQTLVFQAADAFETTLPSVVTSYILSTATMVSFTAAATGPSVDTSTDPSKDSESDSDKGTDKSSNNQTWIGIAAALGGVWVLTLLGLAGFCFHRSRKQRLRQKEEIQPISSISVPYVAQNPEPGPPLTSEMSSTRQSPDLNPSMMGRESLTALPSTEGRSLTHQSVVSELAG